MTLARIILKQDVSEKTLASLKRLLSVQSEGRHEFAHADRHVEILFDHPEDAYEFITCSRSLIAEVQYSR